MPSTPAGIIIDPNGQTVTVNVTAASGAAVAVYTSKDGSTVRNLPSAHTGDPVEFWMVQPDRYVVSMLVNGVENADGRGNTRTVDLRSGGAIGLQAGSSDGDVDEGADRSVFLTRESATATFVTPLGKAVGVAASPLPFFNVKDYGAVGDGVEDDAATIQAAIDACHISTGGEVGGGGGTVYLPPGVYGVTVPIKVPPGVMFRGTGARTDSGTAIVALAGFTGDAVVQSRTWTDAEDQATWHAGSIEDMRVDAEGLAAYAVGIYCMGENSTLRRLLVSNGTAADLYLAGEQAHAYVEDVTVNSGPYGLVLGPHPTNPGTLTGSGGVATILGLSGDNHATGHVSIVGSHRVQILGIKSEGCAHGMVIAGDAKVHLSGSFNHSGPANGDIIRIASGSPLVTLTPTHMANYLNVINDIGGSRTVPLSAFANQLGLVVYGGSNFVGSELVLGSQTPIRARRPTTGVVGDLLVVNSSDLTILQAIAAAGLAFKNNSGTTVLALGATAALSVPLAMSSRINLSRSSQTRTGNGSVTVDAATISAHEVTLAGNATSTSITNATSGARLTLTYRQDATGGRTYAWPATCRFAGGTAPSDTTASTRTSVTFDYDGTVWSEISRAIAVPAT